VIAFTWHAILNHVQKKDCGMKALLNLLVQILLVGALLLSISCSNRTEDSKEIAEESNEGKFETKSGEQDAQFVVDAVSDSYAMIDLAKLAAEKGNDQTVSKAKEIMIGQKKVLKELQAYAAKQVISIPSPGPENLRDEQKDLYNEKEGFDRKWCREMLNENEKLLKTFEEYGEKTEGDLKVVIATSLPTLRLQQDKLQAYQNAVAVND
jgi:putative membrane protein